MDTNTEKLATELKKWGSSSALREQILTRVFGQMPFREAKARLIITPMPADNGDPNNPWSCRLARASNRMFGCQHAIFVGTVAYLDLPDGKGGRVCTRFMLSAAAKRAVFRNDTGQSLDVPETVELLPATKSETLKGMSEASRKRRRNPKYHKKDLDRRNATRKRAATGKGALPNLVRIALARTAAGLHTAK